MEGSADFDMSFVKLKEKANLKTYYYTDTWLKHKTILGVHF